MTSRRHPLRAEDGCLLLRSHSDTTAGLMAIGNATPAPRLWAQCRRSFQRRYFLEGCIFKLFGSRGFLFMSIQYSMKIMHPLCPFLAIWVGTCYHYCQEYGKIMKPYPYKKRGSRAGRQTKTMWTFLDGWTWVSNFLSSIAKIFCFRAKHNHSVKRDIPIVNNCGAKSQMSWEQLAPHLFWY